MSDIYDDDNLNILHGNEIGDPGPGVFAPDAHRLAALDLTHHHDASHGLSDTTVTIAEDPSGSALSCSHGGVSYVSGETAAVPLEVARFWVRSGWATADPDPDAGDDHDTADHGGSAGDGQWVAPPVKARSKSAARRR